MVRTSPPGDVSGNPVGERVVRVGVASAGPLELALLVVSRAGWPGLVPAILFGEVVRGEPMKTHLWSRLVVVVFLWTASAAVAQPPVGALAIDERQGDQWGWAVDYETASAARARALGECGSGCSVVLTFGRCAAYAAGQDADSTAVGWAEAYGSGSAAQEAALAECRSRGGGSGCIVRAWGCNGPVVEEGLNLNLSARRRIQQGLAAGGFDPGGADGLFGPRTRAAIRRWQSSRGARSTGYLDGASAEALRSTGAAGRTVAAAAPSAPAAVPAAQQSSPASAQAASPAASAELEGLFWQSIMNSTDPAEFEAYLRRFPNGLFSELAQARVASLRRPAGAAPSATETRVGGVGLPAASGSRVSGAPAPAFGTAAGGDVRRRPGEVFRDCAECPEMVVLGGGRLAMGRYEVTVGEYRAFASATGDGAGGGCFTVRAGDSWQNPGFSQTDRHPVTCVSWDDAQAYVSWLSRTTGATYRLPTEAEWGQAAAGSEPGCDLLGRGTRPNGTCPVGASVANAAGLSDMVGNVWEWTQDCREGDCGRRVLRGGSWNSYAEYLRPGARVRISTAGRRIDGGFRVSRTLD